MKPLDRNMRRAPVPAGILSLPAFLAVCILGVCILAACFLGGCGDDDPVSPDPDPAWRQIHHPDYTHRAIWGVTSSHFFVVGEKGSINRFADGVWTTWQFLYFESIRGVWGTDPEHVLAVGENGHSYVFDGEDWAPVPTPEGADLMSVWGTDWNDAWAVGAAGTVLRWDGDAWSSVASPTESLLYSVWGSGPDDVFACGRDGIIIHWDGAAWTVFESGTGEALDSVWGYGPDEVYAVGLGSIFRWDGAVWHAEENPSQNRLWAVRGLPGRDPVALGARGTFLTRVDGTWTAKTVAGGVDLYGLWDDGDEALILVGYNGTVMRLTHPAWQIINQGRTHWLTGILAGDCDRRVAVGKGGTILMSLGEGWVDIAPEVGEVDYAAVWGTGVDDFFAVGNDGVIVRYQAGRPWNVWNLQSGVNLEGIWGADSGEVYAVGSGGTIVHFDGVSWETMESGTTRSLSAVHGRGRGDVYAVGLGGTILHYDGVRWRNLPSGVATAFKGVYSRNEGETVVVGDQGLILHSASDQEGGTRWDPPARPVTEFSLYGVTGDLDGNVVAVGNNGVVARFDGLAWETVSTGFYDPLYAIDVGPCGGLYAAGRWGLILEYSH